MWSTFIGNHQKINKVARKKLAELTNVNNFPSNKLLRHFEGRRGPDGIKIKSPNQNEPHAFYDPFDDDDNELIYSITDHYNNLIKELKNKNKERSAFEAAWLAHTLVDGLTPAHHFPYDKELARMRDEHESIKLKDRMKSVSSKVSVKGPTAKDTISNTWKIIGFKGLLTTHTTFEGGVAFIAQPLRFKDLEVTQEEIAEAQKLGIENYFEKCAREVAMLEMYDHFYKYGWTNYLARQVRDDLMPKLIKIVTIAWYMAMREAGLVSRRSHAGK